MNGKINKKILTVNPIINIFLNNISEKVKGIGHLPSLDPDYIF